MPAPIYNQKETRQKVFAEFLNKKFGKPADQVTKQELLHFYFVKEGRKGYSLPSGDIMSVYKWYCKKGTNGEDTFLFMLKDLGYAQRLGITEEDARQKIFRKRSMANSQYHQKKTRDKIFAEFLEKRFGKPANQLTKQDLLSLSLTVELGKKYSLPSGNISSVYVWYARNRPNKGEPMLFSILNDLRYTQRLDITDDDVRQGESKRRSDATYIYNQKETREKVFAEFLEKKFGKPADQVTKQELLSLSLTVELGKNYSLPSGGIGGLYQWYHRNRPNKGEPMLFSILNDLGYTQRLGITDDDVRQSESQRKSVSHLGAKRVVILNPKIIGEQTQEPHIRLPDGIIVGFEHRPEHGEIQVSVSTEARSAERPHYELSAIPLADQIISMVFGDVNIATDKNIDTIKGAKAGEKMVIKSMYPLDEIYLKGLEKLGYSVKEPNLRARTNDDFINSRVTNFFTVIERERETSDPATELALKNQLEPEKTALHLLGRYARLASNAKTEKELFNFTQSALEWLIFIGETSKKHPEQFKNLDFGNFSEDYYSKLVRVERSTMRRLGISEKYNHTSLDQKMRKALDRINKEGMNAVSSSLEREKMRKNVA